MTKIAEDKDLTISNPYYDDAKTENSAKVWFALKVDITCFSPQIEAQISNLPNCLF